MKRVFCTLFVVLMSNQILASIQLSVCDANSLIAVDPPTIAVGYDPNTFEAITLPEVMVGEEFSILVYSDSNSLWSGGLFIEGQDRALGQLSARDGGPSTQYYDPNSSAGDPNSQYFIGSCLEAAGEYAYILEWKDSNIWGFDCYTDDLERDSGNWFVLDYTALDAGLCTVGFYNHSENDWTVTDPNLSISFQNTRTRDLEPDGVVNLRDFAIFASHWGLQSDPSDPNKLDPADFSGNGFVWLEDVIMFADYWLWGTPGWEPAEEVIQETVVEPNIIYDVTYSLVCDPNASPFTDPNSLSDANSLSEITLEVGDSVIIYVDKASSYEDVRIFDMEVTISDPNYGVIDNAASGTAEILAWPRMEFFDNIGPGFEQAEGVSFLAASLDAMWDGDMASFVYTATKTGDVTLDLINYSENPPAKLKSIVIHQVVSTVEMLEQVYNESPDLQESIPEEKWNEFIESVEESTQQ